MITRFCPECFAELTSASSPCRRCGAQPDRPDTYERKLIHALDHRLSDRRVLAARILGELRSQTAAPHLAELAEQYSDPYLAAEAAAALARIDPAHPTVQRLANIGPALARTAVRQALRWS